MKTGVDREIGKMGNRERRDLCYNVTNGVWWRSEKGADGCVSIAVRHYVNAQKCFIISDTLKGTIMPLFICGISSAREVVSSVQFALCQFVC